jgi:peptidyl-tRNA hydrolase, PTH1 family
VDLTPRTEAPRAAPQVPRLIVGLGNPGKNYQDTRHNIGFMVLDLLATRLDTSFSMEKRWNALVAKFAGGCLVKPQTFMNASGEAVQSAAHFYKAPPQSVLVVYDDVDLSLGTLRMRPAGSAGGHNGIRSIIASLGTENFPRLKLGIAGAAGRPDGERMSGHVLGKFHADERPAVEAVITRAADAVLASLRDGLESAMNLFNRKA